MARVPRPRCFSRNPVKLWLVVKMRVQVHESRQQRGIAEVQHFGSAGNLDVAAAADRLNEIADNHDHGILDDAPVLRVYQTGYLHSSPPPCTRTLFTSGT